jgi:hypothetical protein
MVTMRKVSWFEGMVALFAAAIIAIAGTGLGLAAARFNTENGGDDAGIQLVRPLQVSPELDRVRHDNANH